jgi:hypothetical protein
VFTVYNAVIWPLQPIAHALGLLMLGCLIRPTRNGDRFVVLCLQPCGHGPGLPHRILCRHQSCYRSDVADRKDEALQGKSLERQDPDRRRRPA